MRVEFKRTWHVPGFGRTRFKKGVCENVPEGLRGRLPCDAQIMDDYVPEATRQEQEDERKAADYIRAATDTQKAAAGMAGLEDATEPPDTRTQEQKDADAIAALDAADAARDEEEAKLVAEAETEAVYEFRGRKYKTEAAMKAAKTRAGVSE